MIRKFLCLFLVVICLVSCAHENEPEHEEVIPEIKKEEYIDPVKDIFIFGELEEDLQNKLKTANCNENYNNYQFKMWGKPAYEEKLTDIYGNEVDLKGLQDFFLEVVSVECSHCRRQLSVMAELSKGLDVPFVQYFNVGDKESILALYEEEGVNVPEGMIILCPDEGMKDYVKDDLGVKSYPTLITYKYGAVSFDAAGEVDEVSFEMIKELGFESLIDIHSLKDADGNELINASRSTDDVWNDLSVINQKKIEEIDNDDYTKELTLKLMGKKADLSKTNPSQGDLYYSQVDDFTVFEDQKLVLFYTYLRDNAQSDKVQFINDLIDQSDGYRCLVILVEGLESSSAALKNMSAVFRCPVVSVLGKMPSDFFNFGLASYPTAVFIDKGTFTGGYSNISDVLEYKKALSMFLSEKSIAYKSNN